MLKCQKHANFETSYIENGLRFFSSVKSIRNSMWWTLTCVKTKKLTKTWNFFSKINTLFFYYKKVKNDPSTQTFLTIPLSQYLNFLKTFLTLIRLSSDTILDQKVALFFELTYLQITLNFMRNILLLWKIWSTKFWDWRNKGFDAQFKPLISFPAA